MKVLSTSKWLPMVASFIAGVFVCTGIERAAHAVEPAEKLHFVAELEGVDELKLLGTNPQWMKDDDTKFATEIAAAREAWKTGAAKVQEKLTPEKIRSLSHWAKPQMEEYKTVPPLDKTKISAVGMTADKKSVVFEGTIDTLPTHSPLVTRWLKLYFIYDLSTKSIRHTTITIRGQVLE